MDMDQNFNHSTFIDHHDPGVYCKDFTEKQHIFCVEEGIKNDVYIDEEYVNAYDFVNFIPFFNAELFVYIHPIAYVPLDNHLINTVTLHALGFESKLFQLLNPKK